MNKYKYTIVAVLVVVAFAGGRYSVQNPEVKTTLDIKENTTKDQSKNIHTDKTVTTVKSPDGTVRTIENTVTDTKSGSITQVNQTTKTISDVIPPKLNTLNISLLSAVDIKSGNLIPTYGLSVTKEILGPITIGGFGLVNGVLGVSIGLNF